MANLTVDATKVRPVFVIEQQISGSGVAITAGQVALIATATGLLGLAQGTTAPLARAIGVAVNGTAETGMRPTIVRKGIVDLGAALDGVAYGADIYIGDTAGTLSDTAGTVSKVVGTVVPGYGNVTPDKLLRVDL